VLKLRPLVLDRVFRKLPHSQRHRLVPVLLYGRTAHRRSTEPGTDPIFDRVIA